MMARMAMIVVAAQLAAAPAHGEPDEPREQTALVHLDRGVAAYRAGDFAAAHADLAEASRLAPDRPNPYRWLALTEVALGDCRSALVNIESFLSRVAAGDPRVDEVVALRARCLASGTLSVDSTPRGASVRLDDGPRIAVTPARDLAIRPGAHVIALDKSGFAPTSRTVDVRPTGTTFASFQLAPAADAAPMYRRWWFWTAVAAVAVATAGTAFALTRGSDARLPPVTCDPAGCHP
jgi:hypothetical protein